MVPHDARKKPPGTQYGSAVSARESLNVTKPQKTAVCWQTFHLATACQSCHQAILGCTVKAHVQWDNRILCEACCPSCKRKNAKSGDLFA